MLPLVAAVQSVSFQAPAGRVLVVRQPQLTRVDEPTLLRNQVAAFAVSLSEQTFLFVTRKLGLHGYSV